MRSYRFSLVLGLSTLLAVALGLAPLAARMQNGQHQMGSQEHQHQTAGAMQGPMAAMGQMMRNIDGMVANAANMMHDLSVIHEGMGGEQHNQMASSMQGMFDQMRLFQGSMNEMIKDPALHLNNDAMKGLQQACRDLERMVSSFQDMTKHVTQAMKGMPHDPKR